MIIRLTVRGSGAWAVRSDGESDTGTFKNVVTAAGRIRLLQLLSAGGMPAWTVGVGAGHLEPAESGAGSTLVDPVGETWVTAETVDGGLEFHAVFPPGRATGRNLRELVLSESGVVVARALFGPVHKTAAHTLTVDWRLIIQ